MGGTDRRRPSDGGQPAADDRGEESIGVRERQTTIPDDSSRTRVYRIDRRPGGLSVAVRKPNSTSSPEGRRRRTSVRRPHRRVRTTQRRERSRRPRSGHPCSGPGRQSRTTRSTSESIPVALRAQAPTTATPRTSCSLVAHSWTTLTSRRYSALRPVVIMKQSLARRRPDNPAHIAHSERRRQDCRGIARSAHTRGLAQGLRSGPRSRG